MILACVFALAAIHVEANLWLKSITAFQYQPSDRHSQVAFQKRYPCQTLNKHGAFNQHASFFQLRSTENLPDYGKTPIDIDQYTLDVRKRWRRPELFGTSLIDQTISEIQVNTMGGGDRSIPSTVEINKEQRVKRRRALDSLGITSFNQFVSQHIENSSDDKSASIHALARKQPKVFQLNIGLYCNQACTFFFKSVYVYCMIIQVFT